MTDDRQFGFRLFAVIQLFDEHTNRFIFDNKTRLFTDHRVDIVTKDNGVFALSNYDGDELEIMIEAPRYITERLTLKRGERIVPVRLTPEAPLLTDDPDKSKTLFIGMGQAGEYIRLLCPVEHCRVEFVRAAEGCPIFESGNLTHAESGRQLLVTDSNGRTEIVTAAVLPAEPPTRFTASEPLKKADVNNIVSVEPIFAARANKMGEYVIRVENAAPNAEETAVFLSEDSERLGGRFTRSTEDSGVVVCEGEV